MNIVLNIYERIMGQKINNKIKILNVGIVIINKKSLMLK